jgi:hypothetical protein
MPYPMHKTAKLLLAGLALFSYFAPAQKKDLCAV